MKTLEYFEKWFRAKNQAILPLSQQQAEARHAMGDPYVAVLAIDGAKRVIDIAGDWVTVMFLDERDRIDLKYDFKRAEPGRLFLSLATHLEYQDDGNRPYLSNTFAFKPDGSILIERRNLASGDVEEKDSHGDSQPNWEMYPKFGEYLSICQLNRERKAEGQALTVAPMD